MLLELGRGPLEFDIINVATALDEKYIDLSFGDRGFRIQDRASTAVIRVSSIKGEVKKASTADPKPKYWTIPAGTHFESILGIRVMQEDAMRDGETIDYDDVEDGVALEQRWYFTAETADTDIEILIIPGT